MDYLFRLGLVYTGFMKNCFCDVMWNINWGFLCHFACFHDHNSELFTTQLPRQSLRTRKQKIPSINIHKVTYCEMPQ